MRSARDRFVIEHLRLASDARTAEHRSAGRRTEGSVARRADASAEPPRKGRLQIERKKLPQYGLNCAGLSNTEFTEELERTTQCWPMWIRLAVTGVAFASTYLLQIPLEREVPGEPFLLFFLVVIGTTLFFGRSVGFVAVGLSTVLSVLFFEPRGALVLHHAVDLVKIEIHALLACGCVLAFSRLTKMLIASSDETEAHKRQDKSKSILLSEVVHSVANNFAAVAVLISLKSASISDREARAVLDEAIEQVNVMGRVHRRLRAAGAVVSLDSEQFFRGLCGISKIAIRGRPLSIECNADRHSLCMDQAVLLGLIVNELVTNAIKHAFPNGRAGRVRVGFEALGHQLRLSVEDDGVGLGGGRQGDTGIGQDLIAGLSGQLGADLEVTSSGSGSAFHLAIPCSISADPTPLPKSVELLH